MDFQSTCWTTRPGSSISLAAALVNPGFNSQALAVKQSASIPASFAVFGPCAGGKHRRGEARNAAEGPAQPRCDRMRREPYRRHRSPTDCLAALASAVFNPLYVGWSIAAWLTTASRK